MVSCRKYGTRDYALTCVRFTLPHGFATGFGMSAKKSATLGGGVVGLHDVVGVELERIIADP